MKSAVEKLDPTRVKLTVEVTAEELEPHLQAAYAEIGKQISVPGFRKGKVPARIIDQRVGRGYVMQEAVNPAIDEAFRAALEENDLFPMSRPEVDVVSVPGVEDATELKFTAELDVRPEINIPDLSDLELTVDSLAVDAESVEEELTRLRERFASLTGVDREAQAGDFLSLDLKATIDDKVIDEVSGVSHEIGSGNLLEGLDEAVTGAKAGETVNFTTKLAGGEHAGQEADVQVTVTAVKVRELPEVDDEFAQLASEFDTVEELRADLEKTVRERAAAGQAITARDKLVDHLLETVTFDLPKTPVEEEVKRHLAAEGKEEDDEHAAEVRADVEKALRAQLLLDVLAEKNEVEITQGELIEFLLQTAQQYGVEPGQFISGADRAGQIPAFASEVRRNKAIALALRTVTVKDSDGEVVDLEKFVGSDAADAQAQVEALAAQAAELVESDEAAATVDAEIERLAAQAAADIEAGDGDEA